MIDVVYMDCKISFEEDMQRFQMWVRKSVMTVPKVQSSSVPWFVEVMRLTGMASMVGCLAALNMSWSFFPSLTRLYCGVRKMCSVNHTIHVGNGDCIKFLCNGGVVSVFPIGHEVFPQACCVENVGATCGHNPAVVL